MLEIPVKLDVDAKQAEQAIRDFYNGVENALDGIVDLNGKKITFEVDMRATGDDVVKALNDEDKALKKVTNSAEKYNKGQENSISRTKFRIRELKKEQDQLSVSSAKYKEVANSVKQFENKLRTLQGVQKGSIADLKAQRSGLIQLKESARINSPEFARLTAEIRKFDQQLESTRPRAKGFVGAFARIAVVSAGIQAVTSALRSLGNTIDVYVRRTKQIESFNLAIRNVGFTQAETNRIFEQAATTANKLGAPVQQVEKSYQRMIPALQAVGATADESDRFIASISARSATLGLNTEQSGRLLEAFAQVLSKGKLQAEELNQQISELDGAFRVQFADALGVTTEALNELISSSQITADVFVKTVNKMENGVEELERRVKNGTATFQQFQNIISNIQTKNIETIGKAILPALKSFQQISLAVNKFIAEFTKTEQFKNLVVVFNGVAKGAELFVKNLLALVNAINKFTEPLFVIINAILGLGDGFGGLVGLLTQATLAIVAITVATKAFIALKAGLVFVAAQFGVLGNAIAGTGAFAASAGPTVASYGNTVAQAGNQAQTAAGQFKGFFAGLARAAVVAGTIFLISKMIGVMQAAGQAAKEMNANFASTNNDFAENLKSIKASAGEAEKATEKFTGSVAKQVKASADAGKKNASLGGALAVIAAGAGLAAVTVLSGGTALAAFGVAAAAGAGAANKLSAANEQLAKSGRGRAFLDNIQEFNSSLLDGFGLVNKFGGEIGQVDFSAFARGDDTLSNLARTYKANAEGLREQNAALEQVIKNELAREEPNKAIIARAKEEIRINKELQASFEKSAEAASAEIVARIKQGDAAAATAADLDELKRATTELINEIEVERINASTAAIRKFGKAANATALISGANIGIEQAASEERQQAFRRELEALRSKEQLSGSLNQKERERVQELTKLTAQETQKQAQLGIDARNAVIDAFEDGINRANQKVDILGGAADRLRGAFDGITNGVSSGLQAAVGLIDTIVEREISGLEVGDARRRQIIERQLKAQVVASQVETRIAQLKLSVQNKIATSEARIQQLRLRAEAQIAQARGQTGIAGALNQAANAQGTLIKGLNQQYRIESELLKINQQKKEQSLINKGIQEKIGIDAENVGRKIGAQVVDLEQAEDKFNELVNKSDQYYRNMEQAATKTQDAKEATQETSVQEGVDSAREMRDAIGGVKGAADGFKSVIEATKSPMDAVASSAQRVAGYISVALSDGRKLTQLIYGGGAPARAMGGPVTGGQKYTVNDGGGREAFLSSSGKFSMLPAAHNITWTAPSSGTIIPANLVGDFLSSASTDRINKASAMAAPRNINTRLDSGNLVKQMTAAMSASGGNQRITNNVTIQSQQPVTDASQIMTNVARMRLRNGRRI